MDEADKQRRHEIEMAKIRAEIEHMRAMTTKASKEARWYELVIAGGATLALVAIVKLVV
ncbi:MAG: hypothetical protein AAF577_15340 [Pseudomonadota bacterium]